MAHQLYVLQTLMLSLLEQRMMTKMDPQDQDAHDKIKELRKIAFDTEGATSGDITARKQGLFAKDYKKLGLNTTSIQLLILLKHHLVCLPSIVWCTLRVIILKHTRRLFSRIHAEQTSTNVLLVEQV